MLPQAAADATSMLLLWITPLPVRTTHPSLCCDCIPGLFQGGWSFIPVFYLYSEASLPAQDISCPLHWEQQALLFGSVCCGQILCGEHPGWKGRFGASFHGHGHGQGWAVLPAPYLRHTGNAGREQRQLTGNFELVNIDNCVKQTDLSPHEICADQTGTAVYIITSTFLFSFFFMFNFFPPNCITLFW